MIDLDKEQQNELLEINEQIGWDAFINELYIKTKSTYLQHLCELYTFGYNFIDFRGEDDGLCFEIRRLAIDNILKEFNINNK